MKSCLAAKFFFLFGLSALRAPALRNRRVIRKLANTVPTNTCLAFGVGAMFPLVDMERSL